MVTTFMIISVCAHIGAIILLFISMAQTEDIRDLKTKIEYLESVCSQTTEICTKTEEEAKMLKNLMCLHRIESADKITKAYFQGYNKGKGER